MIVCGLLTAALWSAASAVEKKAAAPTVRGTLVAKTEESIDVLPEGEKQAQRFGLVSPGAVLDPRAAAFARGLLLGSEVQVTWTRDPGGRRVTNLAFIAGPGESGLLTGKVTDKSATWVDIQQDQGKTERYMPHRRPGGSDKVDGLSQEMLAAIAQRNIGDRVQIRWIVDHHHRRVSTLRVLALAPPASGQADSERGTVIGRVVDRGKDWVTIKRDNDEPRRFAAQRIVGQDELDKDILRRIATIKRGEVVEARWYRDGEPRLYYLEPATAEPPKTPPATPLPWITG
jgi:hypothetical protein